MVLFVVMKLCHILDRLLNLKDFNIPLESSKPKVIHRYCCYQSMHQDRAFVPLSSSAILLSAQTTLSVRGELSDKRRSIMIKELEILRDLVAKDKSVIPSSLKSLDEGNLIFPGIELLSFLRSVDNEVREFATDSNLKNYPSKFLSVCRNAVLSSERLEPDFRLIVVSIVEVEAASDEEIVNGLFRALVSKLANTRINEFLNARME